MVKNFLESNLARGVIIEEAQVSPEGTFWHFGHVCVRWYLANCRDDKIVQRRSYGKKMRKNGNWRWLATGQEVHGRVVRGSVLYISKWFCFKVILAGACTEHGSMKVYKNILKEYTEIIIFNFLKEARVLRD